MMILKRNGISVNEARERVGLAPLAGCDRVKIIDRVYSASDLVSMEPRCREFAERAA